MHPCSSLNIIHKVSGILIFFSLPEFPTGHQEALNLNLNENLNAFGSSHLLFRSFMTYSPPVCHEHEAATLMMGIIRVTICVIGVIRWLEDGVVGLKV